MHKKYRYGTPRKCDFCGGVFSPRDKANVRQRYCSCACRGKAQMRDRERPCVVCGTAFLPARPETVCCSRGCGTKFRVARNPPDPMSKVRNKIALFCCSCIARSLRGKTDKTASLLGYTPTQLRDHISGLFARGMNWQNYGKNHTQWSIDHKRPISSFPPSATIKQINALSNLQPLWHRQNCSKGKKWENQ